MNNDSADSPVAADGESDKPHLPRKNDRVLGTIKVLSLVVPAVALVAAVASQILVTPQETPQGREYPVGPDLYVSSIPTNSSEDDERFTNDWSIMDPRRSQITYVNIDTGEHVGPATEKTQRPALSLAKLYIADYVLGHGTKSDIAMAEEMIEVSSDYRARVLFEKYPQSIDATAEKYGLDATHRGEDWGYSVTSTYDLVTFLMALMEEDPDSPILVAMADASSTAEDGTAQDYGTATLPGVQGSKWGWSDDRSLHSSASFGETPAGERFVVAAMTVGSADDLTEYVDETLAEELPQTEKSKDKKSA